jgi:diguanylate cyclase (GGDEF)-like protein
MSARRSRKVAVETGLSLSMIMIDLDHFKAVNDKHGHSAGDDVLREVARRVDLVARSKGAAFRYGGEEIVVLLPNHTCDEAVAVAERIRRSIDTTPVGAIQVTASLGVSTPLCQRVLRHLPLEV